MAQVSKNKLRIKKSAIEALMEATQELGIEVLGMGQDMAVIAKHISPTGEQVRYAGQMALNGGRRTCPDTSWMKSLNVQNTFNRKTIPNKPQARERKVGDYTINTDESQSSDGEDNESEKNKPPELTVKSEDDTTNKDPDKKEV